jgi:hypothetical protein
MEKSKNIRSRPVKLDSPALPVIVRFVIGHSRLVPRRGTKAQSEAGKIEKFAPDGPSPLPDWQAFLIFSAPSRLWAKPDHHRTPG